MNYDIAPRELKANGKTYYLTVTEYNDGAFKGWWSYMYKEKGKTSDNLPPEVTDGSDIYYLCSFRAKKADAEEEILRKINTMKKVLTEEDKAKLKLFDKKRLENFWRKKPYQ